MLALSMHNIFKYVIGLKIRRKLVVMFYALSFTTSLLAVFLCSATLISPSPVYGGHVILGSTDITIWFVLDDLLAISSGLTVFLTLQQLSISIQQIFGEIDEAKAKYREARGECALVCFLVSYVSATFIVTAYQRIAAGIVLTIFVILQIAFTY